MDILSQLYKKAAGIPLAAAIIIGIILCVTHDESHYQSEWSTDDGFVFSVGMMMLLSFIISMLSLFILLNRYNAIKKNKILSFLSWALLPSAICVSIIYLEIQEITIVGLDGAESAGHLLYTYIIGILVLHLVCLITTFIIFRKDLLYDFQTKLSHNDLLTQ